MRHTNAWERLWEQLNESTEGPTVTLQVPREVADQLLTMLASSLEMDDDMGGDDMGMDGDMGDDEFGPPPPDDDAGGFSADDGMPDFAAGDDDDSDDEEDSDDDDSDEEEDDDDEDEDDDEETDEAADYAHSGGNPSGLRTQTALGESRRGRRPMNEAYSWRTPPKRRAPARRK